MLRPVLALLFAAFIALPWTASAQSLGDAWEKLDEAMKREIQTPPKNENEPGRRSDSRERQRSIAAELRTAAENPARSGQLESLLSQARNVFQSEEVANELANFRAAMRKECEAKDTAWLARFEELKKHVAETLRVSKDPRDLDTVLKELAQIGAPREERMSEDIAAAMNSISSIRQFVIHWQDYLMALKTGEPQRSGRKLIT